MKLLSSVVAVAVAVSAVSASAMEKKARIDINEGTSTAKNLLINTPTNLLIDANNLVVGLSDNLSKLPGSSQQKAKEWLECMKNDFQKYEDFYGSKAISVVGCSGESLVDGSLTVVRKVSDGVFQIIAVPGHTIDDIGDSFGADIPYIIEGLDDARNRSVAYLTTPVGVGYVIATGTLAAAAGGVGGAPGVGNVISFVADHSDVYNDVAQLVINGVRTPIKYTKVAAIYLTDATLRTGVEVAKTGQLIITDVLESAVDVLSIGGDLAEDVGCGTAKGFRWTLGKAYEGLNAAKGKSLPKAQRAKCELNGVDQVGKKVITVALRLGTLPVRALDRTIHGLMRSLSHDKSMTNAEFEKQFELNIKWMDEMSPEQQEKAREEQRQMNEDRARYSF